MNHAHEIATKLCDNDWWSDLNDLIPNAVPPQKTVRELILKKTSLLDREL